MHIILFSTKVLYLTRCNTVIKEICTVNCKKDIKFHLLLEEEAVFRNAPIYQCNCKEMNPHCLAVSILNQSLLWQYSIACVFVELDLLRIFTFLVWWFYSRWYNLQQFSYWRQIINIFLTTKCFMKIFL